MRTTALSVFSLSLFLSVPALALDAPSPVQARDTKPASAVGSQPGVTKALPTQAVPMPGSEQDVSRYQERQAASPEAAQYAGGDVVVIGASTLTIVLVIVLLVVLL